MMTQGKAMSPATSIESHQESKFHERYHLFVFSFLAVLLQLIPNLLGGYGYFIDEWYYMACARRLAFGYVDHPPLAPVLLGGVMWFAGSSLVAIRILPALAGGAIVFLTGTMAREFGGKSLAQRVAALCAMISPGILVACGFFSVNAFEILFWVLCSYLFLLVLKTGDPARWVIFGLIFGIGLQNKHTMVLLGLGLAVGMLLTPARKHFSQREFWFGAAVAFLIILPNLIWQVMNGWPSLEFYANATLYKNLDTPPLKVFLGQIILQNPCAFPVCVSGVVYLLFSKGGERFRAIGWAFVALLILMLVSQTSRPDRITGVYPIIFAAGGVGLETFIRNRRKQWLKPALLVFLLAGGLLLAPIALPVLPPDVLATYCEAVGVVPEIERGKTSPLPQWFADRFDWDSFVSTVVDIYSRLPAEDKKRAVIFAPSYGHAGALEYYGPGLPRVISNHNSYYLWCAGNANAEVLLAIGANPADLRTVYAQVDSVGIIRGTYGMSWRNDMRVHLGKTPTVPLNDVWSRVKHYE